MGMADRGEWRTLYVPVHRFSRHYEIIVAVDNDISVSPDYLMPYLSGSEGVDPWNSVAYNEAT